MGPRRSLEILNKLKKGTPKVFRGIPATGKTRKRLDAVTWQSGERVAVKDSSRECLIIEAPPEVDIRQCSIRYDSRVDVDVKCRVKLGEWWIEFPDPGDPFAESPADITIILAPDEPDEPDPDPTSGSGTS